MALKTNWLGKYDGEKVEVYRPAGSDSVKYWVGNLSHEKGEPYFNGWGGPSFLLRGGDWIRVREIKKERYDESKYFFKIVEMVYVVSEGEGVKKAREQASGEKQAQRESLKKRQFNLDLTD